jgi:hypothetical protein
MRNCIQRSCGSVTFSASSLVWVSTAQSTAFTTLANDRQQAVARRADEAAASCSVSE